MRSVLPFVARSLASAALLTTAASRAATPPREAAPAAASAAAMMGATRLFLASLGPEEKARAAMPFASEERFNWHYTAKQRNGLPLKRMSAEQRRAAVELLRASLSQAGFDKAETIRGLEEALRALEGRADRDPEMYHFSVFGEPGPKGVWGWRYEGHHLSLNFTVIDGKVVATTPQFFGANPAEVRSGPLRGTRALGREEDLARALARSLTGEQKAAGLVSPTAPPDILTAASRQALLQDDVGVPYGRLDKQQQAQLVSLVEVHAAAQRPELARERLEKMRAAGGLDRLRFVWMGGLEPGQGHYYRVQGPLFLIEYDNTQNGANHIHCVWREFKGDWGRDLLAEHYRTAPHHASARPANPQGTNR